MAGLLDRDKTDTAEAPQATEPAAADAPAVDVAPVLEPAPRACATCAHPLADGQDWCLECGSAQPGRLGTRPGWRAALTVAGACAILATGAGAAAYAALSSESQRIASAPPPPAAAPVVTEPPAVAAPPAEETPVVPAPESDSADVPESDVPLEDDVEPVDPPASSGGAPSASAGAGTSGGTRSGASDDGGAAGGGADTSDEPGPIELTAGSASTYDPYDRAGTAAGDPADAVDGKASTAWEAPVGSDGKVRIGLAVSLEKARTLSRIALAADTPGFTVEVYGSRSSELPPDIVDARWESLGRSKDVGLRREFAVSGKFRHVVLWFTAQPADTKVAINEIQLSD